MAKGDLSLNGVILPNIGIQYTKGHIVFEVMDRTINKTLVSDYVTTKKTFKMSWSNILDGAFMADLIDIYELREDVTFIETQADLTTITTICKMTISDSYLRELESGNYAFSGFSIKLEEV